MPLTDLQDGTHGMEPEEELRMLTGEPASWSGADLVSVEQLTRPALDLFLSVAAEMRTLVARKGGDRRLEGRILGCVFYEPSTRTSSSFQAAFQRLGGSCIMVNEGTSSVQKGETLEDTIRTMACYTDAVVLRHPVKGSARRAAVVCSKPIINAGDGTGEHPTQALLDLLTIHTELGGIAGRTIMLVGDLKHGRTVHSLVRLLCLFEGVSLIYVSPPALAMPDDIRAYVHKHGLSQRDAAGVDDEGLLGLTDVLYVTRMQKERFERYEDYEAVKNAYVVTPSTLTKAKPEVIVMHPLPRVGEIHVDVDSDPRAAYFRQMENGMYARMAIVALLLGHVSE